MTIPSGYCEPSPNDFHLEDEDGLYKWVVYNNVEGVIYPLKNCFSSLLAAEEAAKKRNEASNQAWQAYCDALT